MENIKLSEVVLTNSPSSIIGLTADHNVAQVTVDSLSKVEYVSPTTGTDKMRYTQLRYSSSSGAGSRILLFVPISGLTNKVDATGVLGSLFVLRAGIEYSPMMVKADIVLFRSASRLIKDMNVTGAWGGGDGSVNFKMGHCNYNGQLYLAIKLNTEFSITTCFQGFYTSDCVFRNVIEEDVTDWTDL
ncbi:hypothetical protein [Bacteroides cellulosilyticus]|mgnify:FL=1|uniref:hypothetical protein n=1 Tax=Bacteroides cellulosilyticus TaxID=246787 RepID=UPI0032EBD89D